MGNEWLLPKFPKRPGFAIVSNNSRNHCKVNKKVLPSQRKHLHFACLLNFVLLLHLLVALPKVLYPSL